MSTSNAATPQTLAVSASRRPLAARRGPKPSSRADSAVANTPDPVSSKLIGKKRPRRIDEEPAACVAQDHIPGERSRSGRNRRRKQHGSPTLAEEPGDSDRRRDARYRDPVRNRIPG